MYLWLHVSTVTVRHHQALCKHYYKKKLHDCFKREVSSFTLKILVLVTLTGMSHLKINTARQTYVHRFKNLKRKIYNNANVFFNQECPQLKLIPNYATIKISNTSKASKHTYNKVQFLRIKCIFYVTKKISLS
jgi:hypothetical protein